MIQPDEAKPWPFLRTLAHDPRVPEALKQPHNWPAGVRREYGEDEGFAVGGEIAAGVAGFFGGDADGGVDGGGFAFDEVKPGDVHLVLFLGRWDGLEDDPFHVGAEIAFAGAEKAGGELSDIFERLFGNFLGERRIAPPQRAQRTQRKQN